MSVFTDILYQAIESVPGATGAVFLDWDGEAVDSFCHYGQTHIRLAGAHWGIIYQQARGVFDKLGLGVISLLVLEFDCQTAVVRRITSDYFVMMVLGPGTNLAQAFQALDTAEQRLLEQM